jgi:hypothetical protein
MGELDRNINDKDATKATVYLLDCHLKEVASELCSRFQSLSFNFAQTDICATLHQKGVNLRFLGPLLHKCDSLMVRQVLLEIIIVRTLRNIFRQSNQIKSKFSLTIWQGVRMELLKKSPSKLPASLSTNWFIQRSFENIWIGKRDFREIRC